MGAFGLKRRLGLLPVAALLAVACEPCDPPVEPPPDAGDVGDDGGDGPPSACLEFDPSYTVPPQCVDATCPPGALWGFADLHTHPATHLAMGADAAGNDGPFYGHPTGTLAACDGNKHADFTLDPALDGLRVMAFTALEGSGGTNHLPSGDPDFEGWPDARSPTHQQMHVDWMRRAYEGGLRLMVA